MSIKNSGSAELYWCGAAALTQPFTADSGLFYDSAAAAGNGL